MRRANGEGTVFKSSQTGKYVVRVYVDGKQKQIGTFDNQKDAKEFLRTYLKNNDKVLDDMTIGEFAENITAKAKEKVVESTYYNSYVLPNKFLKEKIGNIQLSDLNYKVLQDFVDSFDKYTTRAKMRLFLSAIFVELRKRDVSVLDYPKLIDLGRKDEKKVHRQVFTEDEIKKLWQSQGWQPIDMALILIYSGMRVSELLEMKNINIHLDKCYMVGGVKTKAGKDRIIPIHNKIKPLIEKYYNTENVFLIAKNQKEGYTYGNFYKQFKQDISKEIGRVPTIHDTRHTFTSLLSKHNVDLYTIKRIIGHQINDVTEGVYIHTDIDKLIQAVNLIVE